VCKDEWRKFVSPTCPGPRSAHAVVATSAGGGKLFLFGMLSKSLFAKTLTPTSFYLPGGEFSSLYQNSFHHYRDFWCFDIPTQSWDRIDTKVRPTARSGHRYAAEVRGGVLSLSHHVWMAGWQFGSTLSFFSVVSMTLGTQVKFYLHICLPLT
jgi:hypothetical protein